MDVVTVAEALGLFEVGLAAAAWVLLVALVAIPAIATVRLGCAEISGTRSAVSRRAASLRSARPWPSS